MKCASEKDPLLFPVNYLSICDYCDYIRPPLWFDAKLQHILDYLGLLLWATHECQSPLTDTNLTSLYLM